jgi:hypothetical protein
MSNILPEFHYLHEGVSTIDIEKQELRAVFLNRQAMTQYQASPSYLKKKKKFTGHGLTKVKNHWLRASNEN